MVERMWIGASLLVALAGCSQAHPTDDVAPGIYDLMVEAESEACTPTRAVGSMGSVAVLVREGAIDAPVPEVESSLLTSPRVRLSPAASFHAETNRRIPDCDGAWVHEEWTVVESTRTGFELLHTQEWQGLASCAGAAERMPSAPDADCISERHLRYSLSEVCPDACRLELTAAGGVACSC